MTIEELKAIEDAYEMGDALTSLAPEILALVEAVYKHAEMGGTAAIYEAESGNIYYALKAFNAKLESL